jgi:CheY-like chemotaxis protein
MTKTSCGRWWRVRCGRPDTGWCRRTTGPPPWPYESGRETIHLVITDLVRPGVGGREVARWTAAHLPELPVLFISGYPRTYLEAHDLYDAGIPLLRKPFLPSRLLEAVQELLPDTPQYDHPAAGNA